MSNKPRRETRRSQILRVFTENGSTFDGMSQSVMMEEIMLNFIIDEDRAARCADFLIARFGTVKRVLSATIDEICEGGVVTEKEAGGIRLVSAFMTRVLLERFKKPIKFDDLNTLTDYLKALYSLECREKLYMFSVDKKGFLKHRRLISEGTYSNVQVDFGQISKFMFNEPSGRFIIRNIRAELAEEGVPMADKVELGIMIETPAAVMMSNSVYAGVPAKKVKEVTPEQREEIIRRTARDYMLYASWFKEEE